MAPSEQSFFPISEISSYQTRWTIRARITNKTQLRTFAKGANSGKVFSADLLDAQGGEIRASFFGEAADSFFDKLQQGKCFTLSHGSVKIANKQFNRLNHRYELVFDKGAQILEVDDDAQIEAVKFSFTDLRSVQTQTLPCTVDLCGMVVSSKPWMSFTSQAGKELVKREITIADDSATSMGVTLWGDRAKQDDSVFENNPVVSLKGVTVKEWREGRTGSLSESGSLVFGCTVSEAKKVQQWWKEGGGATQSLVSLSQTTSSGGGSGDRAMSGKAMDLSEVRQASEQVLDQPQYLNTVCRLSFVQTRKQGEVQPLFYMACQEPKEGNGFPCNRRVDESGFCPTCSRAGKAAPRLNIRCRFTDYGDSLWLTTFNEGAQKVLGMTAEEAKALETGPGGREALEAAIRERLFDQPFQVGVRAKMDSFNGEPRTGISCVDARPVSRGEHGRKMLNEITEMLSVTAN